MSPSESLNIIQEKMLEYLEAGVKLGWLINPQLKIVEIYRTAVEKEVLLNPPTLSGEKILPDFVLDLQEIF